MLTIYRSNRAEWLAALLAEELRINPPGVLENIDIVVNTWPTGRWLGEQIASVNGISAQINFPFPSSSLRKFVQLFLGLDSCVVDDPWETSRLIWPILELLPEVLKNDEAKHIRKWLERNPLKTEELNRDEWQLAKEIAHTFDEYIFYRSDMVSNWWNSSINDNSFDRALPENLLWQPFLFKSLKQKIEKEPFAIQVKTVIKKLQNGEEPIKEIPKRLRIFGINSLAPIQIELIQALSSIIDINIFLVTPCKDLWSRCKSRREVLGEAWTTSTQTELLVEKPRIEANLGRMGSEFEQLLEGSGEYQLGEWGDNNLFAMSANIATTEQRYPNLLEQLQQKLLSSNHTNPLERNQSDDSLMFMQCPGQKRQVQLIRDQIIQWLATDTTLEPRDILIMTPRVDMFTSLIPSIFNDIKSTETHLPWNITDRSHENKPGLIQYMLSLLDVANTRLTATRLDTILTNKILQKRHNLNESEVNKISLCLQKTGFRWGLDGDDRNGDSTHTLTWCLERWTLGSILPSKPGLELGGVAPYSSGINSNELNKWLEILLKICQQLKMLTRSHKSKEWGALLKSILNDIYNNMEEWSWEYQCINDAVDKMLAINSSYELKIGVEIITDILKGLISKEDSRYGHRTGKITISGLEPMRAIPHKVIILMGLDENIFPRKEERSGFSLLEQKRILGDPKASDKDRYVLLEALISARQKLLITWNGRNEKSGETLEPSSPVQQWIEYMESELGEVEAKEIVKTPTPNPMSIENFVSYNGQPPISCDKRSLEAVQLRAVRKKVEQTALSLPLKWEIAQDENLPEINGQKLKSWLVAPQLTWLEHHQLCPKEWQDKIEDQESLSLSELTRFNVLKEGIEEVVGSKDIIKSQENLQNWQQLYAGQGLFPPNSGAYIESTILKLRLNSLVSTLTKLGEVKKQLIKQNNEVEEIIVAGNNLVVLEIGKLKAKSILAGWLSHIKICADDSNLNKTVIISRSALKSKKDSYEISMTFKPIPQKQAQKIFKELMLNAQNGLRQCWPVPPESGWLYAKAKHASSSKAYDAFKRNWSGSFRSEGECDKPEMQLCFGYKCEADLLLENELFKKCIECLYSPLIQAIDK